MDLPDLKRSKNLAHRDGSGSGMSVRGLPKLVGVVIHHRWLLRVLSAHFSVKACAGWGCYQSGCAA